MGAVSSDHTERHEGETGSGRRFCSARTKAGRVCGSPSLKADPDGFCWTHSPTIADKRRESQRRGGATTTARRSLLMGRLVFGTLGEIKEARQALASAVIQGSLPPARASIVGTLLKDAEGAIQQYELAERMDAIESELSALLGRGPALGGGETP